MIVKEHPGEYGDSSDRYQSGQQYLYRRIKDMDKEDTPREKAEKYGCGVLSTADLWALILRTGTVGMPITELCRELMRNNDNRLSALERRSRKELSELKGLGKLKVLQIEAVMELIRRYNTERASDNPIIRNSADIYAFMKDKCNMAHEEIWALILNRRNQIVKRYQASKGGLTASVFDVKLIIKEALLENANAIILCHNHPSGQTAPSRQDDMITSQCASACKTMDISFLDHIIITANAYYSYADEGKL